ncbi:MAG: type II secretion system protein [Crocinitomicaceae bacterium]|jgi:prepilin-type N-terminal cleavage/methylation domain-containing protein|nr:type II secretion system protein [Crocinitomicaceae bacterium]
MKNFKPLSKLLIKQNNTSGFTLIEAIMAIVIIGIAIPTIMIPFQGVSQIKTPEFIIQGSFMAQQRMEELAKEKRGTIVNASNCPDGSTFTKTEGDYKLDCTSIKVNAGALDTEDVSGTNSSDFARKITLTVYRTDGAMDALTFSQIFALD